ncbi:MAG: IclR family transcriptional regulator [Firmicutes bacterium]|jgi:DNA-binding IclR family transcriptional regulator|nr:IclR family transcriptional regulator [Bacillota bacterium]
MEGKRLIKSVDRAASILEELARAEGPVGLKKLSTTLGLNATTCFHLLATLAAHGLVVHDPSTRKYRLGLKMLEFARPVLEGLELRSAARPFLVELMELTEETANLVIFDQGEAVYIDQVVSRRSSMFRMFTQIGTRAPLHCTGVGKVYLAFLPEQQAEATLGEQTLERFTRNTITAFDSLRAELGRVRCNGFALDDEEREEGVRCVAAPIFGGPGLPVAAVSISGPASRLTDERIAAVVRHVVDIAERLSRSVQLIAGI